MVKGEKTMNNKEKLISLNKDINDVLTKTRTDNEMLSELMLYKGEGFNKLRFLVDQLKSLLDERDEVIKEITVTYEDFAKTHYGGGEDGT